MRVRTSHAWMMRYEEDGNCGEKDPYQLFWAFSNPHNYNDFLFSPRFSTIVIFWALLFNGAESRREAPTSMVYYDRLFSQATPLRASLFTISVLKSTNASQFSRLWNSPKFERGVLCKKWAHCVAIFGQFTVLYLLSQNGPIQGRAAASKLNENTPLCTKLEWLLSNASASQNGDSTFLHGLGECVWRAPVCGPGNSLHRMWLSLYRRRFGHFPLGGSVSSDIRPGSDVSWRTGRITCTEKHTVVNAAIMNEVLVPRSGRFRGTCVLS